MIPQQPFQEIPFSSIDENILIGHAHNQGNTSGCTVILSKDGEGFLAGIDCRGGGTCTRETDLLKTGMLVEHIHACVLSGGSVFGLDCSSGVTKYLCEHQVGYHTDVINVPIVCQASLYDLPMFLHEEEVTSLPHSIKGNLHLLPNYYEMGYQACCNATNCSSTIRENGHHDLEYEMNGNIGAGMGGCIGKAQGTETAMKGGLGTFAIQVGDLKIGALVAVNCFGDVIENGKIIAGCLKKNIKNFEQLECMNTVCDSNECSSLFADTEMVLINEYLKRKQDWNGFALNESKNECDQDNDSGQQQHFKEQQRACTNTTLGVVITNGKFDKAQLSRIATMAHDGYARSMKPSHTLYDGDSIFALSTYRDTTSSHDEHAPTNVAGALAAFVVEKAVLRAVKSAKSTGGYVAYCDLNKLLS
ncbi:hypothetical protein C9374_007100 [Naegleria lovaniensis]|uniref:L-aminopeptidase/D-esterase n=1 Tax=Naegleria lovaniensis TaxID=51637 RepID=A0AA88GZP8_NAELO|nr:uncharacterized protein C9374_007100 [Naegleria lovaniensis]KAG2393569.1 hypothetical protein C9374_007100 [Naegleria lovaniensis]